MLRLSLTTLLNFIYQFVNLFVHSKRKKGHNILINNKQSELGYASSWNCEIHERKLRKRDGKKGLERKIDGRKERGNFSREIPSFVPSAVCIPPLLAALSSRGRFFLLHFVRACARSSAFILLYPDFVLTIHPRTSSNRKRKLRDSCVILAY